MAVEMDVVYEGDLRCLATHGPSHEQIITDAPTDNGGLGRAFSPTDLVAAGLAACIITVIDLAAKRRGFSIAGSRAHVTKEMATSGQRRIRRLHVQIEVAGGGGLTAEQRALIEMAADLCPVKQSLHPDVEIAIGFRYEN
jgi:putative redox protein